MRVAIVGGGAAGVALLDSLSRTSAWNDLRVTLYEPTSHLGPGRAYREDDDAAITNRQSELMSIRADEPGHFVDWLRAHPDQLMAQHAVPGTFAPRSIFGQYLRDCARAVVDNSPNVTVVQRRAVEVRQLPSDEFLLGTDDGAAYHHDAIVLCVGTAAPTDVFGLASTAGHVLDPYPLSSTFRDIASSDDVLVVGTGLAAIEVALGLLNRGHQGRLVLASRWGLLPAVRQAAAATPAWFLTQQAIHGLLSDGPLRLGDVWELVIRELSALGQDAELLRAETRTQAPRQRLERHLRLARQPAPWQATLLEAVKDVTGLVWAHLGAEEKRLFLSTYHRIFQSLCNPMPIASAQGLLAAMDTGRLEVLPGLSSVTADADRGFEFVAAADLGRVDVVVNTAQAGVKPVPQAAGELVSSLLRNGLATECAWGGLDVDPMTNALLGPDPAGARPRLFALGELAAGTLYYTSSLKMITSWVETTTEQLRLLQKGLSQ